MFGIIEKYKPIDILLENVIGLLSIDNGKTFQNLLTVVEKNILKNERRDILIINDVKSEKFRYSAQNLAGVKTINLENINLLDLLNHKNLLITENVVKILEKKYA
jgi:ribosomal protein L4